jgi:uncharacterized repeat protein (TIGR03803 family)
MSRQARFLYITLALVVCLKLSGRAQTPTTIYSFTGSNASAYPGYVTPAQGRNGSLYGTALGPDATTGSVFAITTMGRVAQPYTFTSGEDSAGGLILGSDGYLYGTTYDGGAAGYGTLFKLSPAGAYADVHDFQGGTDGANPYSPPIQASDGNFYGATYGADGASTIYRYEANGTFTTILDLTTSQGTEAADPLIQGSDGNLYGTAFAGGTSGCGTLFKLSTEGQMLWTYSFSCTSGAGIQPFGPLMQASDGNFYGTTFAGGSRGNYGTIFKLDQSGRVTFLHNFNYYDGEKIRAGLMQGTDGALYGTATYGGMAAVGTLFKITTSGAFSLLYSFGASGQYPDAAPMQDTNGIFYGTTDSGGRYGYGTVYSLNTGLGPFVTFVQPTGEAGRSAQILGQGLTGATSVTFNGVPATSFTVESNTFMTAVVPTGATTGPVVVTTPTGTLTSNVNFRISQ